MNRFKSKIIQYLGKLIKNLSKTYRFVTDEKTRNKLASSPNLKGIKIISAGNLQTFKLVKNKISIDKFGFV